MGTTTFSGPVVSDAGFASKTDDAVVAGGAALLTGTTSAVGIYVGSGAPTVSAAQGSLYLRTDGSGIANRAYINTNGATTWTAISTAA